MLYLVGGTARDLAGGLIPKDMDLAVEDALETAEMLCKLTDAHYFILDHERKTVRVYLGQEHWQLDITSLNGTSILDDLGRRDFSINAMAIPYEGKGDSDTDAILELLSLLNGLEFKPSYQWIDPYNGRLDLKQKVLKKISNNIFIDDPVRMLRAVRIAGQLGFIIDPETEGLIKEQASLLKGSPGERLREEIMLILSLPDTNVWLEKLIEMRLIEQLLPALHHAWKCKDNPQNSLNNLYQHSITAVSRLEELGGIEYTPFMSSAVQLKKDLMQHLVPGRTRLQILKLAGLMHDLGKADLQWKTDDKARDNHAGLGAKMAVQVCEALALSRRETETISRLIRNHYRIFEIYNQDTAIGVDIFKLIEELGHDYPLLVLLAWADWQSGKTEGIKKEQHFLEFLRFLVREYYENYLNVINKPVVTGKDVMEVLSIGPSPQVGEVLNNVRKAQFMRELTSRDEGLSYLQSLKDNQ